MNEKPIIISKLPMKTSLLYFFVGGIGGLGASAFNFLYSYPDFFETSQGVLDLFTAVCFFILAIFSFLQLSRKTIFYPSKIVWGTVLSKKELSIKNINAHFAMDHSDMQRTGAFRGIIIKKKDGKSVAFHKGELSQFDEILIYLKGKSQTYHLQRVRKLLGKQNRKIYLSATFLLLLLTLSLLH